MDRRTSSTAFTISFDEQDQTAQNGPKKSPGTELERENGHVEEASSTRHHDVLAWEVDFTDPGSGGGDGGSQKTKKMPKFLRERERARQARMEQMKKDYEDACLTSPQASTTKKGMRSTSAPQQAVKSKIPTPNKLSTENRQRTVPPPRPASVASLSTQKIKRSPAIKQPLLLVQSSPQSRTQERKALSATNSPLSSRTRLTKPLVRPASAKIAREMKNKQDKSYAIELNSSPAPKKDEKGSKCKEVTHLKSKKQVSESESTARQLPKMTLSDSSVEPKQSSPAALPEDMAQRKVLDLRRWYCMSRPQYKRSCGISSVVSCWNYLFSTIGQGSCRPLTQEDALTLLGFKRPFGEIRFGPFTGNATCMRWFKQLCSQHGVSGQAYYFYKPVGKGRTVGVRPERALESLKEGLRNPSMAFIYHCYNHYFCPIGYEEVPKRATDAYRVGLGVEDIETWVLIGEPSRKQPGIHCKRWGDIVTDLTRRSPEIFNIRHTERGVQTRNTKRKGGNLHCIMGFKKTEPSPSGFFFNVDQHPDIHELDNSQEAIKDGMQMVPESDLEDLNSSDSDFPVEITKANHVGSNREVEEATKTLTSAANQKQVLEVLSNIAAAATTVPQTQLSEDERSNNPIRIPVGELELEDAGSFRIDLNEENGVDDPLNSTLTEDHQVFNAVVYSSPKDEVDNPSSNDNSLVRSNVPTILTSSPPHSATSPTFTRRGGTYRKKRSTLSPSRKELSPSSSDEDSERSPRRERGGVRSKGKKAHPESSMESPCPTLEVETLSGGSLQRRGTFTKEVPSVRVERTRPLSATSNSSGVDDDQAPPTDGGVAGLEVPSASTSPGSNLKRSGTFTKEKPNQRLLHSDQAPPTDGGVAELEVPSVSTSPGSNLKRSGTFTKEKPEVMVSRTRESSTSSASEKETFSDPEVALVPSSGMKRSGTFTKEKPDISGGNQDMLQMSIELLDYEVVDFKLNDTLTSTAAENNMLEDDDKSIFEETLLLSDEYY